MWHGDGTPATHAAFYDYQAQQMAHIWSALSETPEGDGTMANNTVMLWLNSSGGGHHNGADDWWAMMLDGSLDGDRVAPMPPSPLGEGDDHRLTFVNTDSQRLPRSAGDGTGPGSARPLPHGGGAPRRPYRDLRRARPLHGSDRALSGVCGGHVVCANAPGSFERP